ncbi:MAG: phytanoyl-CoA dioxygenase family protein [Acidimicrobiaceae bacterium]|nr:phytanoyl-CoA dioxygenase family protein [Ilumatobacter sp.]MCB9381265.1 phytanoyl-CoA dioxygenase family protein [Acidimicrobiaceae bacterium]MCO5330106.1 phytanoyl-CoA dioxygenase family protein [Ilumatobacteraceae bacterium]
MAGMYAADRTGGRTEILRDGYTVVEGVLDAAAIARCTDALDDVFATEADIADVRQWNTADYRVAYMLPAKHPVFLDQCRPGPLVELAASVLGDDCVFAGFNGITMNPGGAGQPLHRDHPQPTPGVPLYLHAVIALDRFTVANGATRVVPGSHLGSAVEEPATEACAVHVELAAGAAVVFDAAGLHAGSANATRAPRRALHVLFARRWVQPHWDFPGSLREADIATLDDDRRRLLGFGNVPARYDHDARRSFGYGWG